MPRRYLKKTEYRRARVVVETLVKEKTVVLVDEVIEHLRLINIEASIYQVANLVRNSDSIVKVKERKKAHGAPAGDFTYLVYQPAWERFKKGI